MNQAFFRHFLCFLSLCWVASLSGKSRLGEYYLGFGYSMADGDKQHQQDSGDVLSIMANSPATQSADWRLALEYGNYDLGSIAGDKTSWGLTLDYIMHYDDYVFQNGMFRPYFGIGLGYFSDGAEIHLDDDGFNWSLMVGSEMLFTDDLSMYFGGSFYGMWSDFGDNDWKWDVGFTWWINDIHGISIDYQRPAEKDMNFIGLKYLYSWQ